MDKTPDLFKLLELKLPKNWHSHIDASLSRQPLVEGERLMRYEAKAVMIQAADHIMCTHNIASNAMQIYAVCNTIGASYPYVWGVKWMLLEECVITKANNIYNKTMH